MKTYKSILAIVLLAAFGLTTSAQTAAKPAGEKKTETFKVWGKCDMCKTRLASVGHDTEKYKASDDVYAKLPDCCHYERAK
jgi:hypothetical protein